MSNVIEGAIDIEFLEVIDIDYWVDIELTIFKSKDLHYTPPPPERITFF